MAVCPRTFVCLGPDCTRARVSSSLFVLDSIGGADFYRIREETLRGVGSAVAVVWVDVSVHVRVLIHGTALLSLLELLFHLGRVPLDVVPPVRYLAREASSSRAEEPGVW